MRKEVSQFIIIILTLTTVSSTVSFAQNDLSTQPTLSAAVSDSKNFDSRLFDRDAEIRKSKNPILAYNTAIEQFEVRNYRIAEYFLIQAVEIDPYFSEAYLFLSRIKIRQSDFAKAEQYGKLAVKYNADLVPAHLDLFLIYSRLQRKDEANSHLLAAAKIDPETVSSTASRLITEQDDLYGALFFFEKVHKVAPTNMLNSLNYAKALMIAGRNTHAEKILVKNTLPFSIKCTLPNYSSIASTNLPLTWHQRRYLAPSILNTYSKH